MHIDSYLIKNADHDPDIHLTSHVAVLSGLLDTFYSAHNNASLVMSIKKIAILSRD